MNRGDGPGAESHLVVWGTYDLGKPRVRLLLEGARSAGFEIHECHADVWSGIEDKSGLRSRGQQVRRLLRWLAAYPSLIFRYLRSPRHRWVLVPYLGQLDVLILAIFARLRGAGIVWDVFISLHDTVVDDRRLVGRRSLAAGLLFALEWIAARVAHRSFLDTEAHAREFERRYGLAQGSVGAVPVGAEPEFEPVDMERRGPRPTVLFYGQFIPLHGIDTLIEAARRLLAKRPDVQFLIVGEGQEAPRIDAELEAEPISGVERIRWLAYEELPSTIADAWVCLGIFGSSGKASRVIPNKVYQVLAVGRPIVTADSPAIRELLEPGQVVKLVPPADPEALADAIEELLDALRDQPTETAAAAGRLPRVQASEVGQRLRQMLTKWSAPDVN